MKQLKNISISENKEQLSFKTFLFYYLLSTDFPVVESKFKIFSKYSDIQFLNSNIEDKIYLLYLNRVNINEILYDEEAFINISNNKENTNLKSYFYLYLLISENKNIVNYIYNIEFIRDINSNQKNIDDNKIYKKLIIAKIIIEIIDNYRASDNYNENEEKEELYYIEIENKDIINNNINYLKELYSNWNQNYIIEKKIDKIYIDIIITLFKEKKFLNFDNCIEIFNQLELESINITKEMANELSKMFNKDFIKEYQIKRIDDIFNIHIINLYFLLFKYIFKNPIFIYQIPFLYETRKIIITNINQKIEIFSSKFTNDIKYRIEYIIKIITDSGYYYNKYQKINYSINELSNSVNLEDISKSENDNNSYDILNNSFEYKTNSQLNNNEKMIKINALKENNKEETKKETENDNDNIKENNNNNSKKEQKSNINPLTNLLTYRKNTDISEEEIKKNNNDIKEKIDKNINLEKEIVNNHSPIDITNKSKSNINLKDFDEESGNTTNNNNIEHKNINYSILEYKNILGKHKFTSEMVKEINEEKIISFGGDKKLYIYEINNSYKIKEQKCSDYIKNIVVNESDKNNNFPIICTKNIFNIIKEDINIPYSYNNEKENNFIFLFNINDKFVLIQNNNVSLLKLSFNNFVKSECISILEGHYREGIAINKNIFAITSNRILSGGEDKISFYNMNSRHFFREINGYSFILSSTGLCLMSVNDKNNNNKLLFCACKKYLKNQKNGILLISDLNKINENEKFDEKFYNTDNFEVHCFCQLSIKKKEFSIINRCNSILKTDYFLVGGFDIKKHRGIIKLYKINKKDKIFKIEIIQDIILKGNKEFKGFKRPISCIEQSKVNGDILISSWDGNIYSFKYPDLETLIFFNT